MSEDAGDLDFGPDQILKRDDSREDLRLHRVELGADQGAAISTRLPYRSGSAGAMTLKLSTPACRPVTWSRMAQRWTQPSRCFQQKRTPSWSYLGGVVTAVYEHEHWRT